MANEVVFMNDTKRYLIYLLLVVSGIFMFNVKAIKADQVMSYEEVQMKGLVSLDKNWTYLGDGYMPVARGLDVMVYKPKADLYRLRPLFDVKSVVDPIIYLEQGVYGNDVVSPQIDVNGDGKIARRSKARDYTGGFYKVYQSKTSNEKLRVFDDEVFKLKKYRVFAPLVKGYDFAYYAQPFDMKVTQLGYDEYGKDNIYQHLKQVSTSFAKNYGYDFSIDSFNIAKIASVYDLSKFVRTDGLDQVGGENFIERIDLSSLGFYDKVQSGSGILFYVPSNFFQPEMITVMDNASVQYSYFFVDLDGKEIKTPYFDNFYFSRLVEPHFITFHDWQVNGPSADNWNMWSRETMNNIRYDVANIEYYIPEIEDYRFVDARYPDGSLFSLQHNGFSQLILNRAFLKHDEMQSPTGVFMLPSKKYYLRYKKVVDRTIDHKTITRTIRLHEGEKLLDTIVQKVQFHRNHVTYLESGKVVYGDWLSDDAIWDEYLVPKREGYTATMDKVKKVVVDGDDEDQVIDIYYKPIVYHVGDFDKIAIRTAPKEKGLDVKVYSSASLVSDDEEISPISFKIQLWDATTNTLIATNSYYAKTLPTVVSFKVAAKFLKNDGQVHNYEARLIDVPGNRSKIDTDGYTSMKKTYRFIDRRSSNPDSVIKNVIYTERERGKKIVKKYETFVVSPREPQRVKTGYDYVLKPLNFRYQNDFSDYTSVKNLTFNVFYTDGLFEKASGMSRFGDDQLILDRQVKENRRDGVVFNVELPESVVSKQKGLFKLKRDVSDLGNYYDTKRKIFIPVWSKLGDYHVVFKNTGTIGVNENNVELIENVKLYAYMYNPSESDSIMNDELMLKPIINRK